MLLLRRRARAARSRVAGGKGASLARMTALGLPVPPGFVVPADALAAALARRRRRRCARGAAPRPRARAQAISAARRPTPASPAVAEAYARARRDDPPVAVRSSACAEDSDAACYAGQQETYLHVRGGRRVRRARPRLLGVVLLRAGAVLPPEEGLARRPRDGRRRAADGASRTSPACCSRATRCSGRRDRMVVEAVFGLGEARRLRPGHARPLRPQARRHGQGRRGSPSSRIAIVPPEAAAPRSASSAPEGGEQKLAEDQLRAAGAGRRRPRAALGGPQDIEWALAGRRALRAAGAAGDHVSEVLEPRAASGWPTCTRTPATSSARSTGCSSSIPTRREALQIAAATHDVERAYPDATAAGTPRATGTRPSTTAGTRIAARTWSAVAARARRDDGARATRSTRSCACTRTAAGRRPTSLQAADSLSFLETMVPLVLDWVASGRAPRERARGQAPPFGLAHRCRAVAGAGAGGGAARPDAVAAGRRQRAATRCARWRA